MVFKSYFQQLAMANGVKGFSLVSDNAHCPRYDMKRVSAPAAMNVNGATRKFLSFQGDDDAAPSYPTRRRGPGVEAFQKNKQNLNLRWNNIGENNNNNVAKPDRNRRFSDGNGSSTNNNSMLETVFDQVDSILYEEDEEEEEEDEDHDLEEQASPSKPSSSNLPKDPRFDSNFRRFDVERQIAEDCASKSSTDQEKKDCLKYSPIAASDRPKLPVRQMSVDDFSNTMQDSMSSVLSGASSVSGSIASNQTSFSSGGLSVERQPLSSPIKSFYASCVSIDETNSWHEEEEEEKEDYNDDAEEDTSAVAPVAMPPPPPELDDEMFTPDAQPWQPKSSSDHHLSNSAPTIRRTLDINVQDLELENMVDPPPLDKSFSPPLHNDEDDAYKYRRRNRRSSRRSSLDTGVTFRNSFNSQTSEDGEDDQKSSSRWD